MFASQLACNVISHILSKENICLENYILVHVYKGLILGKCDFRYARAPGDQYFYLHSHYWFNIVQWSEMRAYVSSDAHCLGFETRGS